MEGMGFEMSRFVSVALLMCLAGAVNAKATDNKQVVQMDQGTPVSEQIQRVERALSSEQYSEVSMEDKSVVRRSLDRIRLQMGDLDQIEALSPHAKVEVFNEQERINTILTRAHADSRMTCRRERITGSNFPQNVCMTVAQRRKAEEDGREMMRDANRSQLRPMD